MVNKFQFLLIFLRGLAGLLMQLQLQWHLEIMTHLELGSGMVQLLRK
jgi:hypothetical protein